MNTMVIPQPHPGRRGPLLWLLMLALVSCASALVGADPTIAVLDDRPLAVEGDVLAVPVMCSNPLSERPLPERVLLDTDDGAIEGTVLWIGLSINNLPDPTTAYWTSPIADLTSIEPPSTQLQREQARGYVLCELPPGYRGNLAIGDTVITPRWLPPLAQSSGPMMEARVGIAWPSMNDPGSWWRWALMARLEDRCPPEPLGSPAERLLARQVASLWLAGIERLERVSPGTAAELTELLVARCLTPDLLEVAAWITDPTELGSLLDLMLDLRRDDQLVVRSVLSFLDARFPLLAWVELETGSKVRIGVANPTDGEQVVRLQWIEGDPIPIAEVVPSGEVIMIDLDRPVIREVSVQTDIEALSPSSEFLLSCGRMEKRLQFTSERLKARPPGLRFQPFFLPLSLSDAWAGTRRLPPPSWASTAVLRKRNGRWELFIECMNGELPDGPDDSIAIWFGPPETPVRVIRVGSDGSLAFTPAGSRFHGGNLRVRRFKDRWRAVLVLDDRLISASAASGIPDSLQIGLLREVDGRLFSIAGASTPPWNAVPPAYLVDLSDWGEVLSGGVSTQN